MKVVCNTSPIVWLRKAERLNLLPQLYDIIYTTPRVLEELITFRISDDFTGQYLQVPTAVTTDSARFDKLVRRAQRKLDLKDKADLEVFVTYNVFSDADEMLFANKDAEFRIGKYGTVRDISGLYTVAEEKRIFTRSDSIDYLRDLLKINYRKPFIEKVLRKLGI